MGYNLTTMSLSPHEASFAFPMLTYHCKAMEGVDKVNELLGGIEVRRVETELCLLIVYEYPNIVHRTMAQVGIREIVEYYNCEDSLATRTQFKYCIG